MIGIPLNRAVSNLEIRLHGERVRDVLAQEGALRVLSEHPRLIGRYQEDVVVLAPLPEVTRRVTALQPDRRLQPLRLTDAARMAQALHEAKILSQTALAAFAFPYHYVGQPPFRTGGSNGAGSSFCSRILPTAGLCRCLLSGPDHSKMPCTRALR